MNTEQNNKPQYKYLTAIVTGALFLILIVLVRTVDVAPIGPDGTTIGLSHVNDSVHNFFGVNMIWYDITKYLGAFAIAVAFAVFVIGLYQLISRKSLKKVDGEIISLGVLYAVVIALYALFEVIIINYRPVVMPGDTAPEASFPSTHTMIICTVMGSIIMLTDHYINNERLSLILRLFCSAVIVITVFGRLISGVHWFTDILGGVLISIALLDVLRGMIAKIQSK